MTLPCLIIRKNEYIIPCYRSNLETFQIRSMPIAYVLHYLKNQKYAKYETIRY